MIVICRRNSINSISDVRLKRHIAESIHQAEVDLILGKEYYVFGVLFRSGVPWFYIREDDESEYPKPYCAAFFDLIEMTIPNGWQLQWNGAVTSLIPRSWAEMPNFLERLIDGDSQAQAVFKQSKEEN